MPKRNIETAGLTTTAPPSASVSAITVVLAAVLAGGIAQAGPAKNTPVKEEMYVKLGGIPQWITIKGEDRKNPVVLFLHGGPGNALSPFADGLYAGWEKHFTLVQWDQRGAGRTFGRSGPSVEPTMTVERMVEDGLEIAEFLVKRFKQKKLVIVGGSWGSVLGIHMARARPGLFHAYVGVAQIVNWHENTAASYARVLELVQAAEDWPALVALQEIGAPPWHSVKIWPTFRRVLKTYQARIVTAPTVSHHISPEYADPEERRQYDAADDFSFMSFWGPTLSGPFTKVDIVVLGTRFSIPVLIFQGQEDLTALPRITKAWFDRIAAPRKQFYLTPGTGHDASAIQLKLMQRVLLEEVRPFALQGSK